MWVYRKIRDGSDWLYTVGFYDPEGHWNSDMDCHSSENAAARVNYLNGGPDDASLKEVRNSILEVAAAGQAIYDRLKDMAGLLRNMR